MGKCFFIQTFPRSEVSPKYEPAPTSLKSAGAQRLMKVLPVQENLILSQMLM